MIKTIVVLLLLTISCNAVDIDLNTFSNYLEVRLTHLHLEWLLNLE